jgi:hypothetical protein
MLRIEVDLASLHIGFYSDLRNQTNFFSIFFNFMSGHSLNLPFSFVHSPQGAKTIKLTEK